MIYELRVYHAMPGKLPALVERFGKHTVQIWKRHDIRPVGFWTVDIGENTNDLFYLLQWDDLGHREKATAAFQVGKARARARGAQAAAFPGGVAGRPAFSRRPGARSGRPLARSLLAQ